MHRFCLVTLLVTACAVDVDDEIPGDEALDVCTGGPFRCLAQARVSATDSYTMFASAAPKGYGPDELRQAYSIPTSGTSAPTVAIVVAYGYKKLAADLAAYRDYYGLPPCTVASGCLTIVNQHGDPSPLPPEPSLDNDWTLETMLDVAMVSAACPRCKLLVLQCNDSGSGLLDGQDSAVELGADVISDSWGGPEVPGFSYDGVETHFDHPTVATFVATGDAGYNSSGAGPDYPGTSAHVIAVGGTRLVADSDASRGFTETAWSHGGSACSLTIDKPSYQSMSPCAHRASADIAAVGDPGTGVAVYHSRTNPPWKVLGGTSASAPLMAGLFAAIDRGRETAANLAEHTDALHDVTAGKNGNCNSILCAAAKGWDGPTGLGTPNAARLAGITLPDPPPTGDDPMPSPSVPLPLSCSSGRPSDGAWLLVVLLVPRRRRLRLKRP